MAPWLSASEAQRKPQGDAVRSPLPAHVGDAAIDLWSIEDHDVDTKVQVEGLTQSTATGAANTPEPEPELSSTGDAEEAQDWRATLRWAGPPVRPQPENKHSLGGFSKAFVLGRELGRGSFGTVYEAVSRAQGKQYAVKIISATSKRVKNDAEAEIECLESLCSPHVIRLQAHYCDTARSCFYLVMDLAGPSVMQVLTKHVARAGGGTGLGRELAERYLWHMLSGVAHLHGRGFVHRDVKLANFLLADRSPRAALKLADFGFAVRLPHGDTLQRDCGTVGYKAPEVEDGRYDSGADVWSLGITAFRMCTNQYPFRGTLGSKEYNARARAGDILPCTTAWSPHRVSMRLLVESMLKVQAARRLSSSRLLEIHTWLRPAF